MQSLKDKGHQICLPNKLHVFFLRGFMYQWKWRPLGRPSCTIWKLCCWCTFWPECLTPAVRGLMLKGVVSSGMTNPSRHRLNSLMSWETMWIMCCGLCSHLTWPTSPPEEEVCSKREGTFINYNNLWVRNIVCKNPQIQFSSTVNLDEHSAVAVSRQIIKLYLPHSIS